MPYEFLDEMATADVAFRAWGGSLEEIFVAAADATMNVMVAELDTISPVDCRILSMENDAMDMLLFDLLQEIIFFKDAEKLLLRLSNVSIVENEGNYRLVADAYGEEIDPAKHDLVVDVKAVTLHRYCLEKTPGGWETTIILDI